jgi:AhpD family alkylhydroperoxidase
VAATRALGVVGVDGAALEGCDFCVAGHTKLASKQAGLSRAEVAALQNGEDTGQPRLDAVRRFAEAVIATRGAVSDEALADFRAWDFSEQQALEVVLGISLATLCNFANSLAQSPVNPQLQPYLPAQFQQDPEGAHAG